MQETCLRLMGKKLLVSLAMEGKFSSEGLQSINDEDDILMAMARELVTEKGIGEKADEVWSAIQKRQEAVLGTRVVEDVDVEPEAILSETPLIESTPPQLDPWAAVRSGMTPAPRRNSRRSTSGVPDNQLALF